MTTRIVWDNTVSDEIRSDIGGFIAKYEWLLPTWLGRLGVQFWGSGNNSDNTVAEIEVNFDYRHANLTFYANWLAQDDPDREIAVIHELIHLHTNRLFLQAKRAIESLSDKDSAIREFAETEVRLTNEAATDDLARLIFQRFSHQ